MKKLLLFPLMFGACIAANAQKVPVKFGVKAGVNFPTMKVKQNFYFADRQVSSSFYIGGTADISVGGLFSLQPGINLSGKGAYTKLTYEGSNFTSKVNLMYIEVPVNALVNVPVGTGKVFFGGGPYYGVAISGKSKTKGTATVNGESGIIALDKDIEFGVNGDYKRSDFGVNFLGGYLLKSGLNFHTGYGLGLSDISSSSNEKRYNRVFSVGIGFTF